MLPARIILTLVYPRLLFHCHTVLSFIVLFFTAIYLLHLSYLFNSCQLLCHYVISLIYIYIYFCVPFA